MKTRKQLCVVAAGVALSAWIASAQRPSPRVDDKVLRDAAKNPDEWVTNSRDYAETRYSPLKQIDTTNVSRLGLAWYYDTQSEPGVLEASPIISNGTIYATGTWNVVFALDARTGKEKWRYVPKIGHRNFPIGADGLVDSTQKRTGPSICCGPVNRGIALYNGKVYNAQLDGKLVALDATTGERIWEAQTTDPNGDNSSTGAPRIIKGKVIIGNGGADFGTRGYVTAYDAETGKQAWRFYVVPGDPTKGFESKAMAMAAKTWSGEWWKMGGGGSPWDAFAYDPDLDLLYIGTGNGGPYPLKYRSPGPGNNDNLFLCSIVAVRPETGEYVWHFQEVPGDEWDYTAVQQMTLADLKIDGKVRKVLMQAPKNGFFYVIDRQTGKFISAMPFAKVTWAKGIDQKTGRPILSPEASYDEKGSWIAPGGGGVHSWHGMSYNPATGLVYIPGGTSTQWYATDPDFKYQTGRVNFALFRNAPVYGARPRTQPGPKQAPDLATMPGVGDYVGSFLVAWDPVTQKERWRVPRMNGGGTVTTAGNLVFAGGNDGSFVAFSADKGEKLWEAKLPPGLANPSTYVLDGKQYISVLSGTTGHGKLYTFVLDGKAAMPTTAAPTGGITTLQGVYTVAQAARGQAEYAQTCAGCHLNDLTGSADAPSLVGERFMQGWGGHPIAELAEVIRSTMPKGNPNSLSPQATVDIIAHILKTNQFPVGLEELKSDPASLKGVMIFGTRNEER